MFRTSKERAGAFSLRPPCCLVSSLNRQADVKASRRPHKVRDDGWHAGAEADHVQHAAVLRGSQGEAVGGHAHNDCLGIDDELIPILPQSLSRMDGARPGLAVRVSNERRHSKFLFVSANHRQRAVRPEWHLDKA